MATGQHHKSNIFSIQKYYTFGPTDSASSKNEKSSVQHSKDREHLREGPTGVETLRGGERLRAYQRTATYRRRYECHVTETIDATSNGRKKKILYISKEL